MTNLENMSKNQTVRGLDANILNNSDLCVDCTQGKIHRTPFPKNEDSKAREPFELIHSDVCGKISPESMGGGNYFVTFIDHATRYCWINIIKTKDQVFESFKKWKVSVEKQYNAKVKILRSDNGGEYTSNEFEKYLESEGIIHQKSVPKNPEQNGLAERKNRSLVEATRS